MEAKIFLERTGVVCLSFVLTLILCVIVVCIAVRINSSGKPVQYEDENGAEVRGSIAEKGFLPVNGKNLGYIIKSKNERNPVLLYLHGGMPDYFLTELYPTGLDDLFTVVWLEQRGSGLSYDPKHADAKISLDDLIADTKAVTDYLRERFGQDKIYLMGHSGGTYLAVKTVQTYPELYNAYIAVAQVTNQKLSELKAYEYILEQYRNTPARKKQYEKLEEHPVTLDALLPDAYLKLRDKAMHELGVGTMRDMTDIVTGIVIPSLFFSEYTVKEKVNLWKGKMHSGVGVLWTEMLSHDLMQENTDFKIPVYFLHGVYDYTCSYELAKEYFDAISAPRKGFYTFNNSAHSPIFEEPQECVQTIKALILPR
ncbi:alpha/beta fold hydrolase [Treponema brennaborense]|uniref:Alpha/beta hydrolase fold protein n=1 Tax=Treponema brennaborense (strain DSM 12168 / CIP 105900 / DD5/3) TaxID=906968 RepID=F4LL51_TREBD|nr:alpha/beta hydrolase [Treponema brennaborense]AEE17625.1 alpha/beta hydrolase fold protein [Treponema brennaborense DSM 12168]